SLTVSLLLIILTSFLTTNLQRFCPAGAKTFVPE
ncbi:hypothetical protein Hypma_011170, partial [Hypsizygus marmoreus]